MLQVYFKPAAHKIHTICTLCKMLGIPQEVVWVRISQGNISCIGQCDFQYNMQ